MGRFNRCGVCVYFQSDQYLLSWLCCDHLPAVKLSKYPRIVHLSNKCSNVSHLPTNWLYEIHSLFMDTCYLYTSFSRIPDRQVYLFLRAGPAPHYLPVMSNPSGGAQVLLGWSQEERRLISAHSRAELLLSGGHSRL